jgi:hypothetical protein
VGQLHDQASGNKILLSHSADLRINEVLHFLFRLMTNEIINVKVRMIIDTDQEYQVPVYASFIKSLANDRDNLF